MPRHPPYARYRFVEHTIVVEPQGPAGPKIDDLCVVPYALIEKDRDGRETVICDPGCVHDRSARSMNAVKTSSYAVVKERARSDRAGSSCWRGNLDNTPHPAALAGAGKDERQQVGSSS